MIRVLTTKYGQVVAKVKSNEVTIYDGEDLSPLATAPLSEGDNVVKIIRHLSSALTMRRKLAQRNIKLLAIPA